MTWRERTAAAKERGYFTSADIAAYRDRTQCPAAEVASAYGVQLAIRELAIREMKLKEKAEQRVRELEAGLASKIGPDWREALPYESEFELAGIIEKLKQQIQDVTTGRDKGWARVRELEGREPYLLCTIDHTPPAGWHSWNDRVLDLEYRLAEAQAALQDIKTYAVDGAANGCCYKCAGILVILNDTALTLPPPETPDAQS